MSADVITSLSPGRQQEERPDFLPVSPKRSPTPSRHQVSGGSNGMGTSGNGVVRSDSASTSASDGIFDGDGTDGNSQGKFPTDVIGFASAPPPKNGIFKMLFKKKLQVILTAITAKNAFYGGIIEEPSSSSPSTGNCSLGEGPRSFSPFHGTPTSQPPSLKTVTSLDSDPFHQLSSLVAKDGKTGNKEALPQKQSVWTLNLLDGNLFLFKTDPTSESELKEGDEEEEEEELVEGIELSKFLAKTPNSPVSDGKPYFHLPSTVLNPEWQKPHTSPVFSYPVSPKYYLYRRHDSKSMTPHECILHHDTVMLVLQGEDTSDPFINAVKQDELVASLKKIEEEGKTLSDSPYNLVVHIWHVATHSPSDPNNMAIFFTGKDGVYNYYVHVCEDGSLVPERSEISTEPPENWKNHLEFSLLPFMVAASGCKITEHNQPGAPHGNKVGNEGECGTRPPTADKTRGMTNGKDH